MATVYDDNKGNVSFTFSILNQVPKQGLINDGPVGMNSNLGLVRVLFRIALDDQPWLDADIMVFVEAISSWISSAEDLMKQGKKGDRTGFDHMMCPHLTLNLYRNEWASHHQESDDSVVEDQVYVNYEFFAGLASNYLVPSGGVWEMVPGMYMELEPVQLAEFLKELRGELQEATA